MSKKILIVEDELSLRGALSIKLKIAGFEVFQAKDGEQGLDMAEKERPDLILLDLLMPKIDGLRFMKTIRNKDVWGSKVPIILLTNLGEAHSNLKDVVEGRPACFLVKSNTKLEEVVAKVEEILQ